MSGARVLGVRGDLDLSLDRRFRQQVDLLIRNGGDVILDLQAVTYIDMRGVRELERLSAALRAGGGRVIVARPAFIVRRVLQVLDLNRDLPAADSLDDAVALLRADAGPPGDRAAP